MAAYSYKRVAHRGDFLEMEKTFKERYGEEPDGDPSYLGDNWVIAADLLEAKDARIAELETRCAKMQKGIQAVDTLISESQGVYGLHLNGDVSPWGELLPPGRFSEWLQDFADALTEGGEHG